jgi:hypothetical protein
MAHRKEANKHRRVMSDSGVADAPISDALINPSGNEAKEENLTNYYPGYYLEDGRYIYFEKDETSGYERYGYYNGDGAYIACEGDFSKVCFPPESANSKGLEPQQALDHIKPSSISTPELLQINLNGPSVNSLISISSVSTPQKQSPVSSPGPKLITLLTGGLLGPKPPTTPSKNDPEGFLVDEIVSTQSGIQIICLCCHKSKSIILYRIR